MSRLVDEGWVAPRRPGPSRRATVVALGVALLVLAGWALVPAGNLERLRGQASPRTITVAVSPDGTATADGRGLRSEVRTRGTTRFLVVRGRVEARRPIQVVVEPPVGIARERVAVRVVQPTAGRPHALLLVTMPSAVMQELEETEPAGRLRELTEPLDERIAGQRADRRAYRQLRQGWWWIVPLGLGAAAGAPLWLWRRASRRFFSMRVPGAGRTAGSAPPSSLDPIGASVLVAGARSVDHDAAFAGHVLDLVERRQLRMRRTAADATGRGSVRIGLARADEHALADDTAVAALRTVADPDGLTVELPDEWTQVVRLPVPMCVAWHEHVRARARFERVIVPWPARRVGLVAAASAVLGVAASIAGLTAELDGARSTAWLAAALAMPAAVTLAGWAHDAARWRVVARARRTERAQWLAWRQAIGPPLDPRSIPVVAATGPVEGIVDAIAPADAVALEAVTADTVRALRAMCAGTPNRRP